VTPFEYIILLASFLYALALAHLSSGVGRLLLARERVKFSGLQALVVLNAMVAVFVNWLSAWPDRGVKEWDLLDAALWFVFSLLNYFLCVAATPDAPAGEPIDLDAFYFSHRGLFYGVLVLLTIEGVAAGRASLKSAQPGLFWAFAVTALPYFAPPALALLVKARWAQWVSGVGLLVIQVAWAVAFERVLR